ncbi:MAG: hypothetical protein HRF46_03385 [Acidobacteriota bacterium]|jgi:hypothetical protein
MDATPSLRPLVSWEGFTLRLDGLQLHAWANRELPARVPALRRLGLKGLPDGDLQLEVAFAWKGLPGSVSVRLREARLLHGFFGCQVVAVSGPLGLPLPGSTVASILKRAIPGKVQYDSADGVFLLDLREWLPAGLEVAVRRIHCGSESLELQLGPGSLVPPAAVLGAGHPHG